MEAHLRPGESRYLGNGFVAKAEKIKYELANPEEDPHETDHHEAGHAVFASRKGILGYATNVAEGNSLGHITTSEFDAETIVAPYAMKLGGAGSIDQPGSDLWHLDQHGYDPDTLAAQVRPKIQKERKQILAVANGLRTRRRLGAGSVKNLIDDIDRGGEVKVTIEGNGKTHTVKKQGVKDDHLAIPVQM